jgi:hypothetical protein
MRLIIIAAGEENQNINYGTRPEFVSHSGILYDYNVIIIIIKSKINANTHVFLPL